MLRLSCSVTMQTVALNDIISVRWNVVSGIFSLHFCKTGGKWRHAIHLYLCQWSGSCQTLLLSSSLFLQTEFATVRVIISYMFFFLIISSLYDSVTSAVLLFDISVSLLFRSDCTFYDILCHVCTWIMLVLPISNSI